MMQGRSSLEQIRTVLEWVFEGQQIVQNVSKARPLVRAPTDCHTAYSSPPRTHRTFCTRAADLRTDPLHSDVCACVACRGR